MLVPRRPARLLLPLVIAIVLLLPLPPHALADVTDGGGSADFLLKTFVSGQSGPPASLYYAGGWVNPGQIGGTATQAPAVVTYGQQFWVVVLGTDQQIWQNLWRPSSGWTGWSRLPYFSNPSGNDFTSAPAIAVYNNDVDVFVRGSDYEIYQSSWVPGAGWSVWTDITFPNQSASAPAVTPYTGNNDRNELQLWYLDIHSSNLMQYVYNKYGGTPNAWSGPVQALCCYESAPAVTQFGDQLQVWGVETNNLLYQAYSAPGSGWIGPTTITNDMVGSAPSVTPYGSLFEVFYVMGDATETWETKQLVWDPNNGGWQAPVDVVDISSAPAVAQFGSQLQVWWRDPTFDPSHRTQSGTLECPNGSESLGNYGDTACTGDGSSTFLGAAASWENKNLHYTSSNAALHINNHLWLYTQSDLSTFVETGLAYYGCPPNSPPIICVGWPSNCQPCYALLWAETGTDGNQRTFFIQSPPIDGSRHDYSITRDLYNTSDWDVYYDGLQVDTATHQGSSAAYMAQVGLEVSKAPYYSGSIKPFHADTFHNSYLWVLDSQRAWVSWAYLNYWNDRPCLSSTSGGPATQPLGECMNGTTKDNSTWYVNKP